MLKAEARKLYREKRKALSPAERSKQDDLMLIQFQAVELPFIHSLLSYWPIEENNEPNTHLFTDYLEEALNFAKQNWELNCNVNARFEKMDWRKPESEYKADLLLASDVAYERKSFDHLPNAFKKIVNPGGKVIISEPKRLYAQNFFDSLQYQGFQVMKYEYALRHKEFNHSINVYELRAS